MFLGEVDPIRMRQQGANSTYWGNIKEGVSSLLGGLRLSFRHLLEARKHRDPIGVEDAHYFEQDKGIVTLQYPHESIPVPDNGRYKLHNEIEDCIVCDKCAKICPVDCIEIEPIRAVEEIGKTSDGSSKRIYPAKFDIDMGKCCFCGLCTTVCPTECLTMTKEYDFSEFDVADHNFAFSNMTPLEILEKQKQLEEFMQQKERAKAEAATAAADAAQKENSGTTAASKPAFKPKVAAYKPKAGMMKPRIKPEGREETPQEMAKKIMQQKNKPDQKNDDSNSSDE